MKIGRDEQFDMLKKITCRPQLKIPPSAIYRLLCCARFHAPKAAFLIMLLLVIEDTLYGAGTRDWKANIKNYIIVETCNCEYANTSSGHLNICTCTVDTYVVAMALSVFDKLFCFYAMQ